MSLAGKKVACFVALPHHTRFLFPITEEASRQGAEIVYFTTMGDFPYERDLVKKGLECKLIQSYADDSTRRRLKDATRVFFDMWGEHCFQWDGYKQWPFVLQSKLIISGFEEYFCLDNFFKQEQPDLVMALHERNRWGKLLGHYTSAYGIPYVTLQEGDYYEDRLSFSSHTEYSTALMLWGRFTQDRLVRLKSAPEKMVAIGNTHLSSIRQQYFQKDKMEETKKELGIPPDKKVVLFLVGLQWAVIKDAWVWEELMGDLEERDDVVLVFKWHPKVTYASYKKNTEDFFKQRFPSCIVLQNYDAYRLLPIADYCVTLGKTTLAVEALSFGKPLLSLPGRDGSSDHYVQWGISHQLWPPGNWEGLYKVIDSGTSPEIDRNVEAFMGDYFYKNNTVVLDRAMEVFNTIFTARENRSKALSLADNHVAGRISYIIPGGDNPEAVLLTLQSLAEHAGQGDWEAVVVTGDPAVKDALAAVSGDLRVVEHDSDNLAALYNHGAQTATGEVFAFLKPGVAFYKAEGLLNGVKEGITGIRMFNPDGTPYCLGWRYDFNSVPQRITREGEETPQAAGGGIIAIAREHFAAIGGFDANMANDFVELDLCQAAAIQGIGCHYLSESAAFHAVESFAVDADADEGWQGRIAFFAKWAGRLPKDEDYLSFAAELMNPAANVRPDKDQARKSA